MSAVVTAARAPRRRFLTHGALETVFGVAYVGLMTNLLLLVGSLPFVVLLVTTDPTRSWLLLALAAPFAFPTLTAVCAVYRAFSQEGSTTVVRTFAAAWRAGFRRSLAVGAVVVGALVVLGVDVRAVWGMQVGAVAIPVLAVLIALVVATVPVLVVVAAERPDLRLRDVLRVAPYLALRRWYLTALSLFSAGLLFALFAAQPAVAIGLAAAPLLYVVWANGRFAVERLPGSAEAA
ncbi:hypothetical protein GCM10025865_07670 [Paraoerskovia sediminicola]|uniref:Ferredoxin-NADPH reductase n=1 Tax=Paraoerskovia sediminicola TaxID=1138587 RepID=A0ABM8G054_9CELL|nr:DUF624 domain-containing protein [Paraoerskovia sediminicola]BDZ41468.1 hypothetical protein GCM10025865_07670 [Paraoerskovia sediminicola]